MTRAIAVLAALAAPAAASPLTVELAPGVTLDWQRGVVVARGVGPADRNAPSPEVARVGATRAAEHQARARLTAAVGRVPIVGVALAPTDPAVIAAVGRAPVLAVVRATDGSARVEVAVGLEALRQVRSGPRAVAGDDGAPAAIAIDARTVAVTPRVGLGLDGAGVVWHGPLRYVTAVPAGATVVRATAATAGQLTLGGAVPPPGASVVVVVPPDP